MTRTLGMKDLFGDELYHSEQERQIRRVAGNIAPSIMAYVRGRGVGGQFHAADLHEAVSEWCAPASADRILRLLRQERRLDYVIENRRASLYRITGIESEL